MAEPGWVMVILHWLAGAGCDSTVERCLAGNISITTLGKLR